MSSDSVFVCVKLPPVCVRSEQGFELPWERDSDRVRASILEVTRGQLESEGSWESCARWRWDSCQERWIQNCNSRTTSEQKGQLKMMHEKATSDPGQTHSKAAEDLSLYSNIFPSLLLKCCFELSVSTLLQILKLLEWTQVTMSKHSNDNTVINKRPTISSITILKTEI